MPLWFSSTAVPNHRRLSQDLRSPVTASPLIAESDTVHGYYTITTWQLSFFTIKKQTGPCSAAAGCQNMEVSRQEDRFYSEGRGRSMGCLACSYIGTIQGAVKNISSLKETGYKWLKTCSVNKNSKVTIQVHLHKSYKNKSQCHFFSPSWLLE